MTQTFMHNIDGQELRTLRFQLDNPKDRTLRIPLPLDIPVGPLEVVLVITSVSPPIKKQPLRGRWKKYFSDDFDIDTALDEIRHGWEQEWLNE